MLFLLIKIAMQRAKGILVGLSAAGLISTAWAQVDWRLQVQSLPSTEIVLLGEQHDAAEHQELARLSLVALASAKRVSALVLEMADFGFSTEGMPLQSTEQAVQQRLQWNDAGWPWARYGPVVMQAVRAGVPVVGANLPRSQMGAVMRDAEWDMKVPSPVLRDHRERMVSGHCGLLPQAQVPAMARIQIARDAQMAQTAKHWVRQGQTVLLLAGAEHVKKDRGIPLMLAPNPGPSVAVVWMKAGTDAEPEPALADLTWPTPPVPYKDHCAALAKSIR